MWLINKLCQIRAINCPRRALKTTNFIWDFKRGLKISFQYILALRASEVPDLSYLIIDLAQLCPKPDLPVIVLVEVIVHLTVCLVFIYRHNVSITKHICGSAKYRHESRDVVITDNSVTGGHKLGQIYLGFFQISFSVHFGSINLGQMGLIWDILR